MYHRFDESKYPSTNIQLDVFKEQLKIIENENIQFIDPRNFKENLSQNKKERKYLLYCLSIPERLALLII